ncbi:MAG: iron-containing alcohol dehydrogenase [Spirochaetaceae bacterium]|nr:iron-containing alcohol dehydrogenase [Spirochaetaceae bacterium]
MRFEFSTAGRIVFGRGVVRECGPLAAAFGKRAFVVGGRDASRADALLESLAAAGLTWERLACSGEPTFDDVRAATSLARASGCDLVIGIGGGSAMDTAKAVSALLTNGGDPLDYAEVIGGGRPLDRPALPCIAIPTTAGTGSEVTRNAVLSSSEHKAKASLRSPSMIPRIALVDPELCLGLGREATATTGMDALTQLIEPFVSNRANPFTDSLCREGIERVARSLERACRSLGDLDAREDMSLASLFGGAALANARLGAVHGFAAPLGGAYPVPHGAACAALLAPATAANVRALRSRDPGSPALARYAEIARTLRGGRASSPEDAAPALAELAAELGIRGLASYGLFPEDMPGLTAKAKTTSSMQGNPIGLTDEELISILVAASGTLFAPSAPAILLGDEPSRT